MIRLLSLTILLVFLYSCTDSGNSQKGKLPSENSTPDSFKPEATGIPGEVYVIIDSLLWKSEAGYELKKILKEPIPGLPQSEPFFKVWTINPSGLSRSLKKTKTLIFISELKSRNEPNKTVLNLYPDSLLKEVKRKEKVAFFSSEDTYAQHQFIMHIIAPNKSTLRAYLKNKKEELRSLMLEKEYRFIDYHLYQKNGLDEKLSSLIKKDFNIEIKVPKGYKLAKQTDNFIWLRRREGPADRNFTLYFEDYRSQEQFSKAYLDSLRRSLGSKHIFGSGKPDTISYKTDQEIYPARIDTINFQNQFAVRASGLWKLKNNAMGGAFRSLSFVRPSQNRYYYLEGFVYAPSTDKREYIRELEAIMRSFRD